MTATIKANVKKREIWPTDQKQWDWALDCLDNKTVEITIKEWKEIRSLQQNRYLWGVVYKVISEYNGGIVEDLHNHFKYYFLRKQGRLISFISTTDLDTKEFTDYIEKIRLFAHQKLGLHIPTPDEAGFDQLYE
ncbi:MAG: hypothetical protein U9P90_01055 [Patescibacteria group bacterium]|nr:hypothetical protein [Patescibacteria group bacterium]